MQDSQASNVLDEARSLIEELSMAASAWQSYLLSGASNDDDLANPMRGTIQRYEQTLDSRDCSRRLDMYYFNEAAAALRAFYKVIDAVFYPFSRRDTPLESIDVNAARRSALTVIEDVRRSLPENENLDWRQDASVMERLDALARAAFLADLILQLVCDYLGFSEGAIAVSYSEESPVDSMRRVSKQFNSLPIASISAELRRHRMENAAADLDDLFAAASKVIGKPLVVDPDELASELVSKRDRAIKQIYDQRAAAVRPVDQRRGVEGHSQPN